MRRGASDSDIAAALGISVATAARRKKELKIGVKADRAARRATKAAPAEPARDAPAPDEVEIPDGTTLEQIDRWLKVAEDEARDAASQGEVDNHVKWVRLAASLLEAKRKAQPIPKVDPNDQPDMVAAAQHARERLHKLVDALVRVSASPLADTMGRLLREPPR